MSSLNFPFYYSVLTALVCEKTVVEENGLMYHYSSSRLNRSYRCARYIPLFVDMHTGAMNAPLSMVKSESSGDSKGALKSKMQQAIEANRCV